MARKKAAALKGQSFYHLWLCGDAGVYQHVRDLPAGASVTINKLFLKVSQREERVDRRKSFMVFTIAVLHLTTYVWVCKPLSHPSDSQAKSVPPIPGERHLAAAPGLWYDTRDSKLRGVSVKIGRVTIDARLALAPMAGVTDLAFRTICRELGAGYTVTEMVSAKADRKSVV